MITIITFLNCCWVWYYNKNKIINIVTISTWTYARHTSINVIYFIWYVFRFVSFPFSTIFSTFSSFVCSTRTLVKTETNTIWLQHDVFSTNTRAHTNVRFKWRYFHSLIDSINSMHRRQIHSFSISLKLFMRRAWNFRRMTRNKAKR